MNILGNVKEPFLSEDRFEVTFSMSPPRYGFHLFITGMSLCCCYVTVEALSLKKMHENANIVYKSL